MADTLYANVEDVIRAMKSDNTGVYGDFNEVEKQLLDGYVAAASRQIDRYTNRQFYLDDSTSSRVFTPENGTLIFIDDCVASTVTVGVDTTYDGSYGSAWTEGTQYQLEPLNAAAKGIAATSLRTLSGYCLPIYADAGSDVLVYGTNVYRFGGDSLYPTTSPGGIGPATVQVSAQWGWPEVPAEVASAAIQQTLHLWKSKDAPLGISGGAEMGQMRLLSMMNPTTKMLLAPFIRGSWVG